MFSLQTFPRFLQHKILPPSKLMSGRNVKLPKGFSIWQAYYRLQRGLKAQKKFFEMRTKEYTSKYHFHLSKRITLPPLCITAKGYKKCRWRIALGWWIQKKQERRNISHIKQQLSHLQQDTGIFYYSLLVVPSSTKIVSVPRWRSKLTSA